MTQIQSPSASVASLFQSALSAHQNSQLTRAENLYQDVLALQPNHADSLSLLGLIAFQRNDPARAVQLIGDAIELNPNNAAAYNNRAIALHQLDRLEEALNSYEQAIRIRPDYTEAYYNRGITLHALGRPQEALSSYEHAITLRSEYAEAYGNRGITLQELNRLDEALDSYNRALALRPDYAEAHYNQGLTLQLLKQFDGALSSYQRAIDIKADYTQAHWNLSLLYLLMGNFDRGWKGYEWRWESTNQKRIFPQPLWLGEEALAGKTILLHSEQGLGDTLQFCRYARPVADLGATVILEVPTPLVGLLGKLDGVSQVIAKGAPVPTFDIHCPMMSLPLAFKTELKTIPSPGRYVGADPEKVAQWNNMLGERIQPRIGLAWSGSPTHLHDNSRSIPLSDIVGHLPGGFQYISLQKDIRDTDRKTLELNPQILHFGEQLEDFTDTAALCELMDIVISVDTSVAHLAGAIGRELWVLLPYVPDWRWLLDRDDSPWYPSAKLFRQSKSGDWNSLMKNVERILKAMLKTDDPD